MCVCGTNAMGPCPNLQIVGLVAVGLVASPHNGEVGGAKGGGRELSEGGHETPAGLGSSTAARRRDRGHAYVRPCIGWGRGARPVQSKQERWGKPEV